MPWLPQTVLDALIRENQELRTAMLAAFRKEAGLPQPTQPRPEPVVMPDRVRDLIAGWGSAHTQKLVERRAFALFEHLRDWDRVLAKLQQPEEVEA